MQDDERRVVCLLVVQADFVKGLTRDRLPKI